MASLPPERARKMRKIFTYRLRRTLADLANQLIDSLAVSRTESLSKRFNNKYKGKIAIFANDHIGIHINQYGRYDKLGLDSLFAFLDPLKEDFADSVALDIGANVGNHSMFFSEKFSSVLSFEPNPRTCDLLRFNAKMFDNISVFDFGLGDKNAVLQLNEDAENVGASSVKYGTSASRKIDIRVMRLDEVLPIQGQSRINFAKIDVEGFESNVIRGGLKTIESSQPVIVFEQHISEFRGGSTESIDILKEMGYCFCYYESGGDWRNRLFRRIRIIKSLVLDRSIEYNLITSASVPVRGYAMLIAVPKRFQSRLGLQSVT